MKEKAKIRKAVYIAVMWCILASPGDVVLLLGKGHEKFIALEVGQREYEGDKAIALKAIKRVYEGEENELQQND